MIFLCQQEFLTMLENLTVAQYNSMDFSQVIATHWLFPTILWRIYMTYTRLLCCQSGNLIHDFQYFIVEFKVSSTLFVLLCSTAKQECQLYICPTDSVRG